MDTCPKRKKRVVYEPIIFATIVFSFKGLLYNVIKSWDENSDVGLPFK